MSEAVNECGPRVRASDHESILSHGGRPHRWRIDGVSGRQAG